MTERSSCPVCGAAAAVAVALKADRLRLVEAGVRAGWEALLDKFGTEGNERFVYRPAEGARVQWSSKTPLDEFPHASFLDAHHIAARVLAQEEGKP